MRPCLAEIDLDAVRHNFEAIRGWTSGRPVLAVVKADAYGHGAAAVAAELVAAGAAALGVACLDEALALRRLLPAARIVVLGALDRGGAPDAVAAGLEVAVDALETAQALAAAAQALGRRAVVQLKLDTGMARLGLDPAELTRAIRRLKEPAFAGLDLRGIFTTLAHGGSPKASEAPLRLLAEGAQLAARGGFPGLLRHAANSAAIALNPASHLDMVRPGLLLYGIEPAPQAPEDGPRVRPVLSLASEVVALRELAAGSPVGYGGTWVAGGVSRIATIAMGYADGLRRALSNRADVLIRGRRARLVGQISMDLATVDVSAIPDAALGDRVTLIGRDGGEQIGAAEVAAHAGTIPWEILTGLGSRVTRVMSRAPESARTPA